MPIQDVIAQAADRLTPLERRIAEAVTADPALLAFGTVSDLADRLGTSRPTIVRFATKLGFEGYTDLQQHSRGELSKRLSRPSERVRQPATASGRMRTDIADAVRATLDELDDPKLDALTEPLIGANTIWILSGETSRAGAHALHSGLTMARPRVRLVDEHAAGREMAGASDNDAAVVFDFARYRRHSIQAAQALAARGVRLVAITDGPLSPLAALTPAWCELSVPAVGPFDSSIPAVAAAEMIVARLVARLGDDARARIDRVEQMWQEFGVYTDDD